MGRLAKWLRQLPDLQENAGSNPASPIKTYKYPRAWPNLVHGTWLICLDWEESRRLGVQIPALSSKGVVGKREPRQSEELERLASVPVQIRATPSKMVEQRLRLEVFDRDGYRCTNHIKGERCIYGEEPGRKDSFLRTHHITEKVKFKENPLLEQELGYECDSPENLATTCHWCHDNYHIRVE